MSRTSKFTVAAAFCLAAWPAFAQQDPAAHDAHHPATEAVQPSTAPAPDTAAPKEPVSETKPTGSANMPMMDCMKMMQSMMGGAGRDGKSGGMAGMGGMPMMPMMGAGSSEGQKGMASAPSSMAFRMATEKMHAGMAVPATGNADVDFVRGMIAHHRGAIEMAEAVLLYGKDPEVKKLAEGIINAQEAEVRQMRKWLLEHKDAAK